MRVCELSPEVFLILHPLSVLSQSLLLSGKNYTESTWVIDFRRHERSLKGGSLELPLLRMGWKGESYSNVRGNRMW